MSCGTWELSAGWGKGYPGTAQQCGSSQTSHGGALAAHTSPRTMRIEKVAQRIHLPASLVSPTVWKTLPGSRWNFFLLSFLVFIVSGFFAIKAHLEAANALQLCKGWALNTSQKVLLGVPPWELVALTPPWTQRHPGEQQPQPGLGKVVGFKYLQRKREKKTREKNSKQQTK